MKIVIIEDEPLTAEDLADILIRLPEDIEIQKLLSSVTEAISYFSNHTQPDLIFCDVHLGDGDSFNIFKKIKLSAPVIFCTAYDDYALTAFKNNGIDYILKPFTRKAIRDAIERYKSFRNNLMAAVSVPATQEYSVKSVSSILVNWKNKIIPIKISDIALFRLDHKSLELVTFDNQHYYLNQTLEDLEKICGPVFYRANRQHLINRDVVLEAVLYNARKLSLKLKVEGDYPILISKNRVPEFLSWLRN